MMILLARQELGPWTWALLAALACLGLLAMVSPQSFAKVAIRGSNWIDTDKYLAILDKRVDIDHAVLPFSRVLGFAVIASAILIGVLLSR